jgi:hypothetical protein
VVDPEPGKVVRRREAGLAGSDDDRLVDAHVVDNTAAGPTMPGVLGRSTSGVICES